MKWLFFLSNTLHADLRVMFYSHRHVSNPAAIEPLRAGTRARIAAHMALLEDEIAAQGGPWLLGGELSILDFYLGPLARWAQIYPHDGPGWTDLAATPHLRRLLGQLQERPAVTRACTREAIPAPGLLNPAAQTPTPAATLR